MEVMGKIKRHPKNIIPKLLIFLIMGMVVNSCDLNEHLYSSISTDEFYKSEEEANLALNGVYGTMGDTGFYWELMLPVLSDVSGGILRGGGEATGSGRDISNQNTVWDKFSWTTSAHRISEIWISHYEGINRANNLLSRLTNSSIASQQRKHIVGQAKFLRADFYFDLVRVFGKVPLLIKPSKGLSNINKSRSSIDSLYQQIVKDLQDAQQDLSPYSSSDHTTGKVTSLAAAALLAKVYLQQRNWSKAAAKAKEVINSDKFGMYNNYRDIFRPSNDTGKEMIYSIVRGGTANATGTIAENKTSYLFGPPPTALPNGNTAKFYAHVKYPIIMRVNKNFYESNPTTYRKQQTMTNKMPYYFNGNKFVQDSVNLGAPFITKFYYVNESTGVLKQGVATPIIRYSDMLLTYAEAINEANGSPTQAAYDAINKVRERARAVETSHEQPESVYPDLLGLSQSQFRDSVLIERAREFIGEGKYRYALLRHDKLISNAKQRGINTDENHKLFPLPANALSVNPNLKQNPGY